MNGISLRRVKRGLTEPRTAIQHLNSLYFRLRYGEEYEAGIDFIDRDWDNLLILDACRYDTFDEMSTLPGRLERLRSKASSTVGFLESNLSYRDLDDTVYVTANPQLVAKAERFDTKLHDIVNVWCEDGWSDELQTVHPETMAAYAAETSERYPCKRLIVHFIQPHCPFIGETGRHRLPESTLRFWNDVRIGTFDTSRDTLVAAYRENLSIALEHVESLVADLPGKTVVTSDHGQLIGERSFPLPVTEYGHPRNTYVDELVEVPWLVCPFDDRKKIS
jgi:hypothetical protein